MLQHRRPTINAPTLTAVLESSSDARLLPPGLLLILRRLALLVGLIIALIGRGGGIGEVGGEAIVTLAQRSAVVQYEKRSVVITASQNDTRRRNKKSDFRGRARERMISKRRNPAVVYEIKSWRSTSWGNSTQRLILPRNEASVCSCSSRLSLPRD